ncbi:IclR family transcriptional regulator [Janibacter alittae]|uniref:IclR family transcriptional regulator n=1 Tax=Janibacter alittae TaxID=3115209 RepID=A0ABZ2MHD1_9MICO
MTTIPHETPTESVSDSAWCTSTPRRGGAAGLRSVGTALDVLECFAVDSTLGVSDVARRLGVAKSTAHRVLTTLAGRGFVEQDASGSYRLGLHLYELGMLSHARNGLRHVALPTIRAVAEQTGHTVNLGVPDGADVVFLERIESMDGVRILGHFGRRLPAHCVSSGLAIAAFNPTLEYERREAGFPPKARGTIRRVEDWDRTLAEVRRRGYAALSSGSFADASSLAVPIRVQGVAIGSISVFGPTPLIEPDVRRAVPLLTAAANRIAKQYTS